MITFKVDNLKGMSAALKEFTAYLKDFDVCDDDAFDSRLVCCELISNVLRHCGETAFVSGNISDCEIVIGVSSANSSNVLIKPVLPDVFAESGRGLYIVNAVSGGNIKVVGNDIIVTIKRKS